LRASFGDVVHGFSFADSDVETRLAALVEDIDYAFILLTPSALQDRAGQLVPLERIIGALAGAATLRRAVLSSSTAVYGDRAGATVTAETPVDASGERASRLLAIEHAWTATMRHHVVRLAGLYGPGRVIGETSLSEGRIIDGDPDAWLNLIHVADAAALLTRCLGARATAIELGCDGHPVPRRVYYATLAASLGCPMPGFSGQPAARGGASRRCDPRSTMARTGWWPMYRDFRAGLVHTGLRFTPR
jgi:nucleoside-diphosphate-sugar epimerase